MSIEKILALMSGCDQHKPMPFSALLEKSGLQPDTLSMVLRQMRYDIPMQINSITLTRDGSTQDMYWPTGVVKHGIGPQGIVISPVKRPTFKPLAQREPPREAQPTTAAPAPRNQRGRKPSELCAALYERICEQPGVTKKELRKYVLATLPDATEEQMFNALRNMCNLSKRIWNDGKHGNLSYYRRGVAIPAGDRI